MASLLSARNVNVTQLLTCTFIYRSFINPENWTANSQYLNPVDFSAWRSLQHKLYRQKFRDVDCLKCVLLKCFDQVSQDTVQAAIDQLLKRLAIVIRAQDGHAEFRLNQNVYNMSVNYEFLMNCMQKMNIAKIRCYFQRSIVTLKLRKEYLNIVTYNIPVLLWKKA